MQLHVTPSAVISTPLPHVESMFHVYPPQLRFDTVVPLWSAWQSVFAPVPVHVRPVVSSEPLSVIDEYVPPRLERNVFHAVHCELAIEPPVNDCEKIVAVVHFPPLQTGDDVGHALPQPPQFFASDITSVHAPLQYALP